ncbi:MAG TPA: GDP-mannose 4,6-dehydratase [Planctomycetaceae bacterium]|nr:GDP-mannose 4,6-dehydratase [Planctomycetaceae bacterium]
MTRTALITGIGGQDGSYLAELLLDKGYAVHGLAACGHAATHTPDTTIHYADLTDGSNLGLILDEVRPDEVYHLAAQSHVRLSFDVPVYTVNVTGLGTLRLLEAIRQHQHRSRRGVRFYQASSSEMFGKAARSPQDEATPFHPRSPYACAKVYAYWQTINYREAYGMFASNGILFNHESPRRGEAFVTRKITRAAGRIKVGLQQKLPLGNLDARRDWGFAGDYVEAMWRMLEHDEPDDFVVATGQTHSVREFLDEVFAALDLDWHDYVETDEKLFRPSEVDVLCGDASKARRVLGWEPKVSFRELARMMTEHDLELARRETLWSSPGG